MRPPVAECAALGLYLRLNPSVRVRENEYFDAALRRFKLPVKKRASSPSCGDVNSTRTDQERKRKKLRGETSSEAPLAREHARSAAVLRPAPPALRPVPIDLIPRNPRVRAMSSRIESPTTEGAMRSGEKERLASSA